MEPSSPVSEARPAAEQSEDHERSAHRGRLVVFAVLSVAWLVFLAFGQVRARFWIRNQFEVEFKSIVGVWKVMLGELPGGAQQPLVQGAVLVSLAIIIVGVIAGLYLVLVPADPDQEAEPV